MTDKQKPCCDNCAYSYPTTKSFKICKLKRAYFQTDHNCESHKPREARP